MSIENSRAAETYKLKQKQIKIKAGLVKPLRESSVAQERVAKQVWVLLGHVIAV